MGPDVAAIVNLHREGSTAAASVISAWRSVLAARASGIHVELLLVLDTPSEETTNYAKSWLDRGARIIETQVKDLGDARNVAASATDATWLAFLDGDDLWSENWLTSAWQRAAESDGGRTPKVLHPERNIIFGDHHSILWHIDSTEPRFSSARARLHNPWTALSFVERATIEALPYPRNDLAAGFGFEDWAWNLAVLRHGGEHRVVVDTCHFIRRTTTGSLLSESQKAVRSTHPVIGDRHGALPGAVERVSDPGITEPDLPATHRSSPAQLTTVLMEQVRLATAIEPAIAKTVPAASAVLPTNFNTHVTPEQRALEEIELLTRSGTLLDALRSASSLQTLGEEKHDDVVIEACLLYTSDAADD